MNTTRREALKCIGAGTAAILATGAAPAAIIRSALGARTVYGEEDENPSARSYVKGGLVAMWDGIENAGWGQHDSEVNLWKDLCGENNILLQGHCHVNDDHIHFERLQSEHGSGKLVNAIDFSTIEVVMSKDSSSSNISSCCVLQFGASIYDGYGICAPRNKLCDTYDAGEGPFVTISGSERFSVTMIKEQGATIGIAKNGIFGADGIVVKGGRYSAGKMSINAFGEGSTRPSDLKIWCIRLYNRVLSPDEVVHNHMVDQARFGI